MTAAGTGSTRRRERGAVGKHGGERGCLIYDAVHASRVRSEGGLIGFLCRTNRDDAPVLR